ncbi:GNAT family N-acetyltransferase [Oleomonas cavernae]|uniref:GNAT family N-acetyltransferase n=1 Tax=Oleomonas cavernae TaxID=2320859 RepID=A0A418WBN1_9PROT|nr:GNAT family N-acetyltransferase [Oleomonas cavernae]RJF87338.1 GNAT family N-acetyltransferase [Oleomonas cavernae]
MTLPAWREEPIAKEHPRDGFDCGDADLNRYLLKFARQNHESGGAKTFVAVSDADARILGFYSLAPAVARYDQMPENLRKGLPRHDVPGYRLARLATDLSVQGRGLGGQLLLAAGRRCLRVSGEVGGVALYIDAKNERVAAWYEALGAMRLTGVAEGAVPIPMAIALKTIAAALAAADRL